MANASSVSVNIEREVLERESKIYGRSSSRSLSKYEETINKCALACCEQDATLLKDRDRLYKLAREKADHEGYQYKKRKSRSSVFGEQKYPSKESKRVKLATEQRQVRIAQLNEDVKSCADTIKLLELQRAKFVNAEKYLQAAEMVTQISESRTKLRRFQAELSKFQKADGRSKKYHKRKNASKCKNVSSSTVSLSEVSPQTSGGDRKSSSTSTERESDIDTQESLNESEDCIEVESAIVFHERGDQSRIDTFFVSPSKAYPATSVPNKSCDHESTELRPDVDAEDDLHLGSENHIQVESFSPGTVANRDKQHIDTSTLTIFTSKESHKASGSTNTTQEDEITAQELPNETCEEQYGSGQASQSQDDRSVDSPFCRVPQTM